MLHPARQCDRQRWQVVIAPPSLGQRRYRPAKQLESADVHSVPLTSAMEKPAKAMLIQRRGAHTLGPTD